MDEILKTKTINLTPAQQKVLKYIFNNLSDAVFMTASTLGRKTDVSEATIIRLSQALDFDGFPAFQKYLRQLHNEMLTTVRRLEKRLDLSDTSNPLVSAIQMDIKNMSTMAESISEKKFDQVVNRLWKAKKIKIIGLRSAFSMAVYLKFGLQYLGRQVSLIQPTHGDLWDHLAFLSKDDLLVAISFPRYSSLTVDIVALAKQKKCRIVALTDSLVSPLTHYSDWILTAPCQSDSYMDSFTAPMGLLHALLTSMSLKKPDTAMNAFRNLETIWDKHKIYFSPEGQ